MSASQSLGELGRQHASWRQLEVGAWKALTVSAAGCRLLCLCLCQLCAPMIKAPDPVPDSGSVMASGSFTAAVGAVTPSCDRRTCSTDRQTIDWHRSWRTITKTLNQV